MSRHAAYIASIVLTLLFLVLASRTPAGWWGVAVFGALAGLAWLIGNGSFGGRDQSRIGRLSRRS